MSVVAPPVRETARYKPVAGLAVLALLFGLASPLVFFLGKYWALLLLPVPGLIFAVMARRKIEASHGALAGYVPATFGAVLSVACGLGWTTHYITQNWILESESRRFVEAWFDKLKSGQDGLAFMDCVEPVKRKVDFPLEPRNLKMHFPPPTGSAVPFYDVYRYGKFTSVALRYGQNVTLQPVGRPEIRDAALSYGFEKQKLLKYQYLATSPLGQGVVEVSVATSNVPVASGFRREWHILSADFNLTDANEHHQKLAEATESGEFAMDRMASLIAGGDKAGLEKLFVSPDQRGDLDRLYTVLRGSAAAVGVQNFKVRKPMLLLGEEQKGRSWRLVFRGQFENDTREVEYEMALETPSLMKELDGWRYANCRLLGERRRIKVEEVPVSSRKRPAVREDFRPR